MRNTTTTLAALLCVAALLVASASASTRSLAQFSNGIQSPSTLYIPGLGLSVQIGNIPGFYTEGILDGLTDGGPLEDNFISSYLDYGIGGLLQSSVGNSVGVLNDVLNPGGSTITVGWHYP